MTKRILITCLFLWAAHLLFSQSSYLLVLDSLSGEPLIGATVQFDSDEAGTVTDETGKADLSSLTKGPHALTLSYVGYESKTVQVTLPGPNGIVEIKLIPTANALNEVLISSTRSNTSAEQSTQKVEVLGLEEVTEESTIKPGNIASLLGDLSVIHIQPTSATSGASVVRLQGLGGQYTQLLRDGLPLYEGFSGNFGVLQIPPLDLQQVEILKGSNSTLYGGGAIGGLINFISRKPGDTAQGSALLNQSTLGESNLNAFYTSKAARWSFSGFIGLTHQTPQDVNNDEFSDVPRLDQLVVHPTVFFNPNAGLLLRLGVSSTLENRDGGDIRALKSGVTNEHPFLEKNRQRRIGVDFSLDQTFSSHSNLNIKGVWSRVAQQTSALSDNLKGVQNQAYWEVSQNFTTGDHSLVGGLTFNYSKFDPDPATTIDIHKRTNATPGLFLQDEWHLLKKFGVEGGIRVDHHNEYNWFVLPRLAFRWQPSKPWVIRMSAGAGYKTPDLFTLADIPADLGRLPLQDDPTLKPERSQSINADIQWKKSLGEDIEIHLDQAFYGVTIRDPLILSDPGAGQTLVFENSTAPVHSLGTDTYLSLTWGIWELYAGYNHTEAWRKVAGRKSWVPFAPQDKIAGTLAFDLSSGWRGGIEVARNGNQYLNDGAKAPDWWFWAASISKKFFWGSLTLNGENLFDYRQSRKEAVVSGPVTNPIFADLWAPSDGRVINFSIKYDW